MKTLFTLALVALTWSAAQPSRSALSPEEIFSALEIKEGQTVGEIGAGDGELSLAVARSVGPTGKVFTSELGRNRISTLESAVKRSALAHVTVVEGDAARTNFPDACCDAVFMRNVYHHFADPGAMNASIFKSVKPGGRVAVIDFAPSRGRAEAARPADRADDDSHGTTAETVTKELTQAGFQVVRTDPGNDRWFMVVATKPR